MDQAFFPSCELGELSLLCFIKLDDTQWQIKTTYIFWVHVLRNGCIVEQSELINIRRWQILRILWVASVLGGQILGVQVT